MKKEKAGGAPRIYIGPAILGCPYGTVFKNGLVPALEKAIKENPAFGELVVPVSGLAKAQKELRKEGTALNRFYKAACK